MKVSLFFAAPVILFSCNTLDETIQGNGNQRVDNREASFASKIDAGGSFQIHLVHGDAAQLSVEADENLLPYIITEFSGDKLKISVKKGYSLKSPKEVITRYTTNQLSAIDLAGHCSVFGEGQFTGSDDLDIEMSGTGSVNLAVNYPRITSEINGSGTVTLSGETADSKISISGLGNYNAEKLKSETVEIDIAGAGDAIVFASRKLAVDIAGSGNVSYFGSPEISQSIAGSGKIRKAE